MSINDIEEELNTLKQTPSSPPKKTITDILDNNIRNLENFVGSKVINIYSRPWNKLEPKLKKRKIAEFIEKQENLNEESKIRFNNNMIKLIDMNIKIKLDYDKENCEISKFDYHLFI